MAFPLAARLQAQGIPFVFCTGYEHVEATERFRDYAVLCKPINMVQLNAELHRISDAA
jgi:hypothetical protein